LHPQFRRPRTSSCIPNSAALGRRPTSPTPHNFPTSPTFGPPCISNTVPLVHWTRGRRRPRTHLPEVTTPVPCTFCLASSTSSSNPDYPKVCDAVATLTRPEFPGLHIVRSSFYYACLFKELKYQEASKVLHLRISCCLIVVLMYQRDIVRDERYTRGWEKEKCSRILPCVLCI
jgi:hypothetical protein